MSDNILYKLRNRLGRVPASRRVYRKLKDIRRKVFLDAHYKQLCKEIFELSKSKPSSILRQYNKYKNTSHPFDDMSYRDFIMMFNNWDNNKGNNAKIKEEK